MGAPHTGPTAPKLNKANKAKLERAVAAGMTWRACAKLLGYANETALRAALKANPRFFAKITAAQQESIMEMLERIRDGVADRPTQLQWLRRVVRDPGYADIDNLVRLGALEALENEELTPEEQIDRAKKILRGEV